jgi:hypothetical protein
MTSYFKDRRTIQSDNVADFLIIAMAGVGFGQLINYRTPLSISFYAFAFS